MHNILNNNLKSTTHFKRQIDYVIISPNSTYPYYYYLLRPYTTDTGKWQPNSVTRGTLKLENSSETLAQLYMTMYYYNVLLLGRFLVDKVSR